MPANGTEGRLSMSAPPPADSARAVSRALSLLEHVVTSETPPSLAESSRFVGLPVSTTARLLKALERRALIRRDAVGRYWPGVRMFHLATSAMRALPLHDLAEDHLRALTGATAESSYLLIPSSPGMGLYVRQVESPSSIRHASWVGRAIPLAGTATGAALVGSVGARGYAIGRHAVEPDTATAAAPVFAASGEIQAAISVIAPSFRVDDAQLEAIGALVAEHARALSAQIGAPQTTPSVLAHSAT